MKLLKMSQWPRIILLGDSITQRSFDEHGWGAYISGIVQRKCDVFNRGYSGYNTDFITKVLPQVVDENLLQNVAAVTLFLGANDSSLAELNQKQHVPLQRYETNLVKIIGHIEQLGVDVNKIITISPPAVDEKAWGESVYLKGKGSVCDRDNSVTESYAKVCRKIAEQKHTRHIDLWSDMMATDNMNEHLSDGLHLSIRGNLFLAKSLEPHILDLTKDLPTMLPAWDEFQS